MWEEIKPKKFHKAQVTIPFFSCWSFFISCARCASCNILQASRKDVASIHTSLASCEHYDWSACLQRAYCMRVTFQKYACANTLRALMCACNTHAARLRLACCVLAARRLRAFFSARGMFAIFIRGGSSIFTSRFLLVFRSQLEFVLWWCGILHTLYVHTYLLTSKWELSCLMLYYNVANNSCCGFEMLQYLLL